MGKDGPGENGDTAPGFYTQVLGLAGEVGQQIATPERRGRAVGTVFDQPEPEELIELTVIVPARNEEACLGACLESLVGQSEEIFELGKDWELVVVDDHSTDHTRDCGKDCARALAGSR